MNAETIDRSIAWLIALCQPHHPNTILEEGFDFSSRKYGLAVGTQNNLHHHTRMIGRTTRITQEGFKRFIRNLFDEVVNMKGDVIFF